MRTQYFQKIFLGLVCATLIAGCSAGHFMTPRKPSAHDWRDDPFPTVEGKSSYYAEKFHGLKTSNGEIYDMNKLTAAHREYPFNTVLRVTNLSNGRSVEVRVNDRGPWKEERVLDVSRRAAEILGMIGTGTAQVRIEVRSWGDGITK